MKLAENIKYISFLDIIDINDDVIEVIVISNRFISNL